MNITDVRLKRFGGQGKVKAVGSITVDGDFVVHEVKVINGVNGLFVALPSRKMGDGIFRDLVHPITAEAREAMQKLVLERYIMAVEGDSDGAVTDGTVATGGVTNKAGTNEVTAAAKADSDTLGVVSATATAAQGPGAAAVAVAGEAPAAAPDPAAPAALAVAAGNGEVGDFQGEDEAGGTLSAGGGYGAGHNGDGEAGGDGDYAGGGSNRVAEARPVPAGEGFRPRGR